MDFRTYDHYVEQNASELLNRLAALCRIPSVSAERGPAMAEAAGFVLSLCHEAGLAVETVPQPAGPPLLIAQGGAGARCLMIYNHYDVQPADPQELWQTPPFQPVVRDGKLYARGASDNKADLVARLSAIRIFQETAGPLPLRLLYVIEGEEETGSQHLFRYAAGNGALLGQADGCLWEYGYKDEDDRPVVSLGVKGILSVELRVRTAGSDAHSGWGGLFPNAAWRLVEALHTLRAPDGRPQIDGLMDTVQPPSPAQLALLADIPLDSSAIQHSYGLRSGFLGGLEGADALRRWLLEPTVTINGIWGGYTGPGGKTVIPAQAAAKLDLRLVPDLTPALALQLLRDHLRRRGFDDIEVVDTEDGLLPARTAPETAIARSVVQAVQAVSARPPVVFPSSAGSGPVYELCGIHGVPVASAGAGWANSLIHAPNESVRVADYLEAIRFMGRLLAEFAVGD
jgi:acetylornithine deacetylase/succinyl-diaminopimelate desuccinylase-like protein